MAFTIQQVNDKIRFLTGGLSQEVMPDATLDYIIQLQVDRFSFEDKDFCKVTYFSLIDTLNYLIRQEASKSGGEGAVSEREEVQGKRKIRVKYDTVSGGGGWQSIKDEFELDPDLVCQGLADELSSELVKASVIVGGVSQKEYNRVNSDPDSRNMFDVSVRNNYDRQVVQNIRRRRGY